MPKTIFISHRSTDKAVADMLMDFFIAIGADRNSVFCSSLPGNDVKQKISEEVKTAMKDSCLSIAILSNDYYDSAYCLNEAGVLWYNDTPVIVIALPEITSDNMIGFLNNEYKLRRLDNDNDNAYICDELIKRTGINYPSYSIIMQENQKLKERYNKYLDERISLAVPIKKTISDDTLNIKTQKYESDNEDIKRLREGITQLRKVIDDTERIIRNDDPYITLQGDDKEIKYCATCWGKDNKLIQVNLMPSNGKFYCPHCKTTGVYDRQKYNSSRRSIFQ